MLLWTRIQHPASVGTVWTDTCALGRRFGSPLRLPQKSDRLCRRLLNSPSARTAGAPKQTRAHHSAALMGREDLEGRKEGRESYVVQQSFSREIEGSKMESEVVEEECGDETVALLRLCTFCKRRASLYRVYGAQKVVCALLQSVYTS